MDIGQVGRGANLAWHVWNRLRGGFLCGVEFDLLDRHVDKARTRPTCKNCLRLMEV